MSKHRLSMAPSFAKPLRCTSVRPLAAAAALAAGLILTLICLPAAPLTAPSLRTATVERTVSAAGSTNTEATPDLLAMIVSRKYRVSEVATREFVRAAYLEASRLHLDPLLIVAVIAVESRFNPVAQSESGAMGLMQIIPRFHAEKFDALPHGSLLDPRANIQVGARILKEYITRGGTEPAGLQLYNGSAGDPEATYSTRVLAQRQWLKDALRRARDRTHA